MATVRPIGQKRLLGVSGNHAVVTDRRIEEGGSDVGCTSGELLLLSIGSCATGSLRNYLETSGLSVDGIEVNIALEPVAEPDEREAIAIDASLPAEILNGRADKIENALRSGRVVSRIRLGSRVVVRCHPTNGSAMSGANKKDTAHE